MAEILNARLKMRFDERSRVLAAISLPLPPLARWCWFCAHVEWIL